MLLQFATILKPHVAKPFEGGYVGWLVGWFVLKQVTHGKILTCGGNVSMNSFPLAIITYLFGSLCAM
jgi:hypothetical protein